MVQLKNNEHNARILVNYLNEVDHDFKIPLSEKISLKDFALKILSNGYVLAVLDNKNFLVGVNCFYCNDEIHKTAYFIVLSVKKNCQGKGYAKQLIFEMINICKQKGMVKICCETVNPIAASLYESIGFKVYKSEYCNNLLKKYLTLSLI